MFQALFPFKSNDSGTLEAKLGDIFCAITSDTSGLWLQAANAMGDVGYLPKNYLQLCDSGDKSFVMKFLDTGIARANQSMAHKYGEVQLEKLRILTLHRKYLDDHYTDFIAWLQQGAIGGSAAQRVTSFTTTPNSSRITGRATSHTGKRSSHIEQNFNNMEQLSNHTEQLVIHTKEITSHTGQPRGYLEQHTAHHPKGLQHQELASEQTSKSSAEAAEGGKRLAHCDLSKDEDLSQVNQSLDKKSETVEKASGDVQGVSAAPRVSSDVVARQLVEVLRTSTQLSHDMCKVGVVAVLETLVSLDIPQTQLDDICKAVVEGPSSGQADELSSDVLEMAAIFDMISECKDDSQQRSWPLHEDEAFISGKLSRLLEILTMGNREALLKGVLDNLDQVHHLVIYYQLETRSSLRAIMLQIFAALCTMSSLLVTNLLCSVLTLELVRDLMSTSDEQRLMYSAVVLSMLFSTGEPIPVQHNNLLSSSFVDFLLDKIETSIDSRMADVCFELLLSFNQHFSDFESNTVLQQLSSRQDSAVLTQNFLKLFNSGEDPVCVIPNEKQMNSVLKFAIDLYSQRSTSRLIYTNDAKVLIEIIIRQLTNLSDEDAGRSDYLSLMHLVLINSDYHEHCHRKADLLSAINQIEFNEESTSSQSEMDVRIVQEIRKAL